MKRILILLVAVTPLVAFADKNYTRGKGGSWDCKKDPVVNISHGKATYKFTGTCTTVNVSGGSLKISADRIDTLNISGAKNVITVKSVGAINVTGAKNTIAYKSGDAPTVADTGVGNIVAAPAAPKGGTVGSTGSTTTTAPTASGGGTAVDCAKTPSFSYNENGGTFTFTGKCDKIAINGNDANLTVENVKTIAINGNNVTAKLAAVDAIATNGNNNTVTYKTAVTANGKVKVSNPGNQNTVTLVK